MTVGVLLGGCQTDYLIDPAWLKVAKSEPDPRRVAVQAVRVLDDPPIGYPQSAPQQYVRLSALTVQESPPTGFWRASARNLGRDRVGGGVLVGLGGAAFLYGGAAFAAVLGPCSNRSNGCDGTASSLALFLTVPSALLGIATLIPGAILLHRARQPRPEVPPGLPELLYIPSAPGTVRASGGTLP